MLLVMAGCPQCGEVLPARARFCPACGAPVESVASAEVIKLVTILFADVVGSTAQAEQMQPEDTRALMAEFFDAMSEEIRAEGGTIERLVGDAIMADFGVPVAHEDDPVRAVRAALRMLARLDAWNAPKPDEQQIRIRIGINTGEVSTGGSFGEQLMVMGDAVNVAARLQQAAEPGTIVVGERTARAIRGSFRLHPLDPIAAKGKTRSLQAFVVESELDRPERPLLHAPLVGRTDEMDVLRKAFDLAVREPAAQFVLIVGDAGVGKTRLVEEFVASLPAEVKRLSGRCLPYGDGVTLSPLQEILRSEAGIVPQDDPGIALKKVQELLLDIMGKSPSSGLEGVSAALASTLGSSSALGPLGDLDPRLVYSEMVRAWRTFLTALGRQRPLLVIIEDVYWADPTMLDVLADLSEHLEGPISFVLAARPDFLTARADWLAGLRHSVLRVEPLEAHTSKDLAVGLLGGADVPLDFMQIVLERAEGNPLFIEEILLRLVDEGYLRGEGGTWKVTGDLADVEIPERVQTLIQARLDLLSAGEREVLQAGAVIGRNFWSGAVAGITGFTNVREIIDRLKPGQMISERPSSAIPGETEFAFRHLLIRDVVYESQPRRVRGEAHAAVGRWIETIRGARIEEVAELLADHYERAYEGLGEETLRIQARRYLLMAAQGSLRRFAITQAEFFGRRAVGVSLTADEKIEALEILGDAFYLALRGTLAWEAYSAAIAELEEKEDAATLARVAAKAAIVPTRWMGTMDEDVPAADVDRVISMGLEASGEVENRDLALLLSARAFLAGTTEVNGAGDAAEEAARDAVAIAEKLKDPDLLSAAMDASGVLLWPTGRYGDIISVDRARVELIPELSDLREVADILLSTGRDLTTVGHYKEALDHLNRAVSIVKDIDPGQYLHALVHLSSAQFFLGRWDEALRGLAEIERLEGVSEEEAPQYAVRAFGIGYFCSLLRDDARHHDRYLQILRTHRGSVERLGLNALDPLALPARALARAGHVDEAWTWLSFERWAGLCEHLEAACDIVALWERWDLAGEILNRARGEVEHAQVMALSCHADRLEGHILNAAGEHRNAVDQLIVSAEGFSALGAVWEEALSRLWAGRFLRDNGAGAAARAQLEVALPVFQALQSVWEQDLCRELVASL